MGNKNTNIIKNKDTYTVKDFCKKYNGTNVEQTKQAFVEKIMNQHYVPYERKITICENIIESSYYKKSKDGESKKLHVNSPAKYMLYCLNIIKEYTYINIDFSNVLEEFNMLNECGLLDILMISVSDKEIKEFRVILDMVEDDVIQNEYEIRAFISNQVERFGELFGYIAKPALDRFSETLKNMDEKTMEKTFNKLKGLIL